LNTIKQQHQRPMTAASSITAAAPALQVLLVEDSKVLTERLSEVIRQLPEVVLIGTVDTEDDACAAVAREQVDVMILDLHLRKGNGFGVLRALAQAPERPFVIVLTNYDLPQYKDAALALGANYFMDKIRDYDKLPDVLQEIYGKARSGT
jgi:two-component system response regulator (stage 0 sporulation protein A)